jgi:GT2 family glycosyltransferase
MKYLKNCIATILSNTRGMEFEIIVIDGASFDGCEKMLLECYPQVRFIQSDNNVGFAKANNEAFNVSHGRNLLFLNPDTELENGAIEKMLRNLESLPDAGAVGAKLLNTDKTIQTSCIQSFPTIFNQVFDSDLFRRLFQNSHLWGNAALFKKSKTPVEVDAISGACLMVQRSVFENIERFSTDYFMYSEDIDLCFKVQKQGWKTYFVPAAVIVHHGGGSSAQSKVNAFSSVMMLESRWRFFRKTRNIWYCWLYRLAMFSASAVRICLLFSATLILGRRGKGSPAMVSLKNWSARLRWTLGLESWAKKY